MAGTSSTSRTIGVDNLLLSYSYIQPNQPPVVLATSSAAEAETDEEIIFDGRSSSDDGQIIDWYWDFGDGNFIFASTTSHAYGASGSYDVYLKVTDDLSLSATSSPLNIVITAATTTATTTPAASADALVINEVYPAPLPGENEWVEIYNSGTSTVDLAGLLLLNIDGDRFVTTTLAGLIEAGGYAVIENITGSLNNSGDTVVLRSMLRSISQTVYGEFPDSHKGASWARGSDNNFSETITPTKGAANAITARPAATGTSGGGGGYSASNKTETATTTASSTIPLIDYSGLIVINEIYPNPGGILSEEFIEFFNLSTSTLDLAGFVVADSSKNKHLIKASTTAASSTLVMPGGFFVLTRGDSGIALNNTGVESVSIYSPDLKLVDRVEYLGENDKGVSYSRTAGAKWRWVKTPTPSEANADDELYPDEENPALLGDLANEIKLVGVVKPAAKSKKVVQDTTLEQLNNFSEGDSVRVRGVVSVLPGVLGSQYFYLAGSGAQIYSYKKDFPDLQIGDYLEVTGELSGAAVGRRIKITDRSQIKFIEKQTPPAPHQIMAADVGEDYDSWLVIISGEVLEIKSRNIYLDDGSEEVKIYINNQIDLKDINAKPGDKITVTGIVNKSSGGYRLMPRDLKDIKVEKGEVKGEFVVASAENKNIFIWYLGALVVFLLGVIVILGWKLRNKK